MRGWSKGWTLCAMMLVLWGCSGPSPVPEEPAPAPEVPDDEAALMAIPPSWRTCQEHSECITVAIHCCPCGEQNHIVVHKDHANEARQHLRPTACNPCPAQDCPRLPYGCTDEGLCGWVEDQ